MHLPGAGTDAASEQNGHGGLVVLVQERSDAVTGPVEQLGSQLMTEGMFALFAIGVAVAALWFFALRARSPRPDRSLVYDPLLSAGPRPLRDRSTLSETGSGHG
jgi:hypothetical protein